MLKSTQTILLVQLFQVMLCTTCLIMKKKGLCLLKLLWPQELALNSQFIMFNMILKCHKKQV